MIMNSKPYSLIMSYLNFRFFPFCFQLIVAVTNEEVPRLEDLYQRGVLNGVKGLTFLSKKELKEVEPHCEVIFISCFILTL